LFKGFLVIVWRIIPLGIPLGSGQPPAAGRLLLGYSLRVDFSRPLKNSWQTGSPAPTFFHTYIFLRSVTYVLTEHPNGKSTNRESTPHRNTPEPSRRRLAASGWRTHKEYPIDRRRVSKLYKEILKHPEVPAYKNVLYIVGLVFFLMVLTGLANAVHQAYNAPYLSYLVFLLTIAIVFYILSRRMVRYRYSLIHDELIFQRMIGKNEKLLLHVHGHSIRAFGPLNGYDGKEYIGKISKVYRYTLRLPSHEIYSLIFEKDGRLCRVDFQPSPKLIAMLEKCLAKTQDGEKTL